MKTTRKTKINKKDGAKLYESNPKYQGIQQKTNRQTGTFWGRGLKPQHHKDANSPLNQLPDGTQRQLDTIYLELDKLSLTLTWRNKSDAKKNVQNVKERDPAPGCLQHRCDSQSRTGKTPADAQTYTENRLEKGPQGDTTSPTWRKPLKPNKGGDVKSGSRISKE